MRKRCAEASDDPGFEEGLSDDGSGKDPLEPPPKKSRKTSAKEKASKPKKPKAKATARVSRKAEAK